MPYYSNKRGRTQKRSRSRSLSWSRIRSLSLSRRMVEWYSKPYVPSRQVRIEFPWSTLRSFHHETKELVENPHIMRSAVHLHLSTKEFLHNYLMGFATTKVWIDFYKEFCPSRPKTFLVLTGPNQHLRIRINKEQAPDPQEPTFQLVLVEKEDRNCILDPKHCLYYLLGSTRGPNPPPAKELEVRVLSEPLYSNNNVLVEECATKNIPWKFDAQEEEEEEEEEEIEEEEEEEEEIEEEEGPEAMAARSDEEEEEAILSAPQEEEVEEEMDEEEAEPSAPQELEEGREAMAAKSDEEEEEGIEVVPLEMAAWNEEEEEEDEILNFVFTPSPQRNWRTRLLSCRSNKIRLVRPSPERRPTITSAPAMLKRMKKMRPPPAQLSPVQGTWNMVTWQSPDGHGAPRVMEEWAPDFAKEAVENVVQI